MAQFARPSGTNAAGGWVYSTLSLHEDTDEITPNGDTDYAEANAGDTIMKLALSSVTDPGVGTGHTLRFTAEALNGGGGPEKLDVQLYEGVTLIVQAFTKQGINRGSYQLYEYTYGTRRAPIVVWYLYLLTKLITLHIAKGVWWAIHPRKSEGDKQ